MNQLTEQLGLFIGRRCWQVTSSEVYWLMMDFGDVIYVEHPPKPSRGGRVQCALHGTHSLGINDRAVLYGDGDMVYVIDGACGLDPESMRALSRYLQSCMFESYEQREGELILRFTNGNQQSELLILGGDAIDFFFQDKP